MKSSCRSNHHSDQHLSIRSSIMITASARSPPFVTTPSSPSSTYARSPFPDLPLAANLADHKGTSSSPSKAQVSLHKTSAKSHKYVTSSLITSGSDFEFDSCCLSEINDHDPPVSPKLICPSATTASNYWGRLHNNNGRLELIMQQSNPLTSSSPHTPVTSARHQPSAPSSPSGGGHLVEEKVTGYGFAYKSPSSAPQTTNLQQKQDGQLVKQLLAQDNSSLRDINIKDQTRSCKSAVLERRALMELSPLMMQKQQLYLAGRRLENNSHLLSSSSSNGSSAMQPVDINTRMDQAATSEIIVKKHSGGDSNYKKWAFKDFLRRTVPSSKGDRRHHHHHQSKDTKPDVESPRKSTSSLISSSNNFQILSGLSKSTAPMSRAAKRDPTVPGRPSPMRSPQPRSPMSPHVLHYRRKKARSEEIKRKTFLPYRQSILGCFGPQQVW